MPTGQKILIGIIALVIIGGLGWRIYQKSPVKVDERSTKVTTRGDLNRPISVGIVTWGGYAGGIMENNGFKANKNCDFFRNHGVQVDMKVIDDYVECRSAFKAGGDKGGIDIAWGTVDAYALEYPALAELNAVCILQYDWSRGGDAIAVDGKKIRNAADLRGKTIAVAEETPSHYFALFVLEEAGLKHSDVKWVFTNSAIDAANAFKAGKTDACVSWSPDVYIAARERQGGKVLMSTREATHLIADIFIARGDFIEKYPNAVKSFVNGWLEGVNKVHQNPTPVYKLMADGFSLPIEDAEAMLGDVYLPNYADNVAFFNSFNPVGYDAIFKKAGKLWKDFGKIDVVSDPKVSRNTSFLINIADSYQGQKEEDPYTTGAAFAEKKPGQGKNVIMDKKVTINFPTGSSTLDEDAMSEIRNNVAGFVATLQGCFVSVEGNTDNVGDYNYNRELSRTRALSVKDFLVSEFKMDNNRFDVNGNSWDKPVASNNTAEGRAQNRRTDIVIKTAQ